MSTIIKDGSGKGFSMTVDDHGRAYTRANIVGHMSHHSTYHLNAYLASFETTLVGTSETPCAFLLNADSTKDIEIYWFWISTNAATEIRVYSDNDYSSGGNEVDFYNANLGNPNALGITSYEGGASATLALTTTHNFKIHTAFLAANDKCVCDFEGGVVLGNTRSIAVKATGTSGDKVSVTMGYALHVEGARL